MSFSKILSFFSDPTSMTALGITLMLMLMGFIYYYFYSTPSSSNSSETKKEKSSSNSSEPKKEDSSSNSSEPKKEILSSNSSEPKKEESSSNSSETKKENSSSNSSEPKKEESSSNSSEPKIMVSTSTSSIKNSFKYDVFISFRGEDTRKNFVDHLYHALKDRGIYTYKDDVKIQKGKRISDDLFKSIEDSKFYIIVFSKNYASSSWCLEELVKIMECHKMTGHTAYPVFYNVEPTEVRKQSGAVGEAFAKHENEEAVGKWREALQEAADLAGWELKNTLDGHEAKFINKIVQEISLELRYINSGFDEKLVGMETRVEDVVSSLEVGIDEVRMIGIKGMGGAGKTTTSRAVFDHLSNHFEAKIFVENVREVSNGSMSGLKKLQEQVLSDVLNEQVTLESVHVGKNMMKRRMCGKKVLLVLDDVDHIKQLEALAGEPKWFKPGSRILITTRDEQVLVAHRVNVIRDIVLLSKQEAISLFSRYAFGRENPLQGYEGLSGKVVRYAAGLPLTLEVLGSFLCGKDKLEWVDAIDRLKRIPLKDTLEKLELSYISLEDEHKEIFLDIACILKGQTKDDAIRILECCGFYAIHGLKVLEQRSLIIVSPKYGGFGDLLVGMHDQIEEMGKNIVRREHPDKPNKHSRLWIKEEIEDILDNDMGTEATRCLKLMTSRGNSRIDMKGLRKMKKLQYLEVLNKLKFLSLSELKLTTFDFRITPNLEMLSLTYSFNLKELHMPVCCQNLKHLHISWSKLRTFDLGLTPNLEKLYLERCFSFVELHVPVACPNLKFLYIYYSRLRSLDLELIPNLERLDLNSIELIEINAPAGCPNLERLYLHGCVLLEKLPENLGQSGCLKELVITDTSISHLPRSIFGLKGLSIRASEELLQLYDFPSEIKTTSATCRILNLTAKEDNEAIFDYAAIKAAYSHDSVERMNTLRDSLRGRGRRLPHCQLCRKDGHYANECLDLASFASRAPSIDANLAQAFHAKCISRVGSSG
ncbi:disease resistance TIR-NBS-LRR class family protein [Tanacetum coccineum]|uniref:Disease resistance TIR-NBS-LRR class family protein n=1 Tax=Tanacetum coccineum TaxID=301880 RepID=A0ABQ5DAY3_9ASTR